MEYNNIKDLKKVLHFGQETLTVKLPQQDDMSYQILHLLGRASKLLGKFDGASGFLKKKIKLTHLLKKEKSDHICDHEELMFVQIKNKSFTQALDTSKQIGYYNLNSLNARDVDYKELVDESTRLHLKYEDPKQLNDNEKKRFQNLTFISWRASLICQYKFEIFKAQYKN